MAGRRAGVAHYVTDETRGRTLRALYPEELKRGRDLVGNYFPQAIENIIELASGFKQVRFNKKGEEYEVIVPPNLQANIFLVSMMNGVPGPEPDPILERLNTARAVFMEKQVIEGFVEAQVEEILSRAKHKGIESSMWAKQFVTEEMEQERLQAVAEAVLRKLMAITPEEYEAVTSGKGTGDALESLKGHIGVTLAEVMEEVMGADRDAEPDDEEEEEGDDEEAG